ncbi:carbonic anhydrase 12 isoform X1 [Pleurodeles waltl]|uniref:carbonic anhydrase 12 isoform X1 n=1 Tax=Pleurodeles waltl TaxID=8319 RepID=UPI0037099CDB
MSHLPSLLLLLLGVRRSLLAPYADYNWSYVGPDGEEHWHKHYPFCGGIFQSPIDIHNDILQYDSTLLPIELVGYNLSLTEQFIISNNGHSLKMSLPPTMYISSLPFRYTAAQLHLHWGNRHHPEGSEHSVNGKRYAAELHIVHYNSDKYPDVATAMDKADGLAVLGILIELGSFHPSFENIFCQFANVRYKDQTIPVTGFNVRDLLPERLDEYYRYEGSLTTPPCYPSVLWTVFRNPVQLAHTQLVALETALYCTQENDPSPLEMTDNYRQPQEFDERRVRVSFRQGVVLSVVLASILGVLVIIAVACCLIRKKLRGKKEDDVNKAVVYKPALDKEEDISNV